MAESDLLFAIWESLLTICQGVRDTRLDSHGQAVEVAAASREMSLVSLVFRYDGEAPAPGPDFGTENRTLLPVLTSPAGTYLSPEM